MTSEERETQLKAVRDAVAFSNYWLMEREITCGNVPDFIAEIERTEARIKNDKIEAVQKHAAEIERLKSLNKPVRTAEKLHYFKLYNLCAEESKLKGFRAGIKAYTERYCTPKEPQSQGMNPEDCDFI